MSGELEQIGEAMRKLSPQRREFVREYAMDFNATRAAIAAGYSEKTAYSQGSRLTKYQEVQEALSEYLADKGMSREEAVQRMAMLARSDFRHFTVVTEEGQIQLDLSTEEAQAMMFAVKEIKQHETVRKGEVVDRHFEIKLHDAKDALHKILQAHGVYETTLDIKSSDGSMSPVLLYPSEGIKARMRNPDDHIDAEEAEIEYIDEDE